MMIARRRYGVSGVYAPHSIAPIFGSLSERCPYRRSAV